MKVCVGTIVHHPEDARIMHRQIRALLDAGHEVTYIAPFTHCNVTPPQEIRAIDVPRAVGLRRGRAHRAARAALRKGVKDADLLLVHDIELLFLLPRRRPTTVWDVHEDIAGSLETKPYLSELMRRLLPHLVHGVERRAERRHRLILAEAAYRDRFTGNHPVVPNTTYVPVTPPPPPGDSRIVYVGHLSEARGVVEMIELARRLRPHGIRLDLIGGADAAVRPLLRDAQREGLLDWFGYVPNDHALRMAQGALAGLSLLHDVPNYRQSLPTKVIEYMARGIPVITTPLPHAASIVGRADCGLIVPYGDVDAMTQAVLRLRDDPERRAVMGAHGYAEARGHYHWPDQARDFVSHLEEWAVHVPSPALHRVVPA
ncbi:glycosyltransferase [Sphaerisporangium corydalis]|uniref:Glycosyltransferase n=1 Tax=Sphaerisporangium corydalis TaxID=1441875 RepID=A0ABV9ECI4_9ACTN|nr:glycosyltransferase [Sphaerisporangium corydalis]